MEYHRSRDNQIQADFAFRVGKLALQYTNFTSRIPQTERYDATLTICLLQSLLTICHELIKAMCKSRRLNYICAIQLNSDNSIWGLKYSFIKRNECYNEIVKLTTLLGNIRNSLSHPTILDIDSDYPSTGYTTINSELGFVKEFCFITSPDVAKSGVVKKYQSKDDASKPFEEFLKNKNFKRDFENRELKERGQNFYQMWSKITNRPLAKIFRIDIPLENLKGLVLELSNFLAQPTQPKWDGQSISELIRERVRT